MKFARIIAIVGVAFVLSACNGSSKQDQQIDPPGPPTASVSASNKKLIFSWNTVTGATHYRLLENLDGHSGFSQIGADIPSGTLTVTKEIAVHLHDWVNALYMLQACNGSGCTGSTEVSATGVMLEAIGTVVGSNTEQGDIFGAVVALSADGRTLAVGATREDSNATGINGDEDNNSAEHSGTVYVFVRDDAGAWSQQAYVKASNTDGYPGEDVLLNWPDHDDGDAFGSAVALSDDGDTLAVGARYEASDATGVNGDQSNNDVYGAGAVYIFTRDGAGAWSQQAYIKASKKAGRFGRAVSLRNDGNNLAVGAAGEVFVFARDSIDGWSQEAIMVSDTEYEKYGASVAMSGSALAVGAPGGAGQVYMYVRDTEGIWSRQASITASNPDPGDSFGNSVAMSGQTLVVGAPFEDSSATGINGDQTDNSTNSIGNDGLSAGAVYVFRLEGADWNHYAYIKPSNTGEWDFFGSAVALSQDENVLAVGALGEDSGATGINGDQNDNSAERWGAVYVFRFDGTNWSQQSYLKPPDVHHGQIGVGITLNVNGDTLAMYSSHWSHASPPPGFGVVLVY